MEAAWIWRMEEMLVQGLEKIVAEVWSFYGYHLRELSLVPNYKTQEVLPFEMTIFYPFHIALDENGIPVGFKGTSPILPTPPMIIFMDLLDRWLESKAVSQHDIWWR